MNEASSSQVEIRRLWPSDKEAFRDHLLSLDPRSRHLRFGGGMSDDFLVHYAENCFGKGDLIYGAFVDSRLVGAAELRSNQAIWSEQAPFGRNIHAEAAFSVDERYRRRGVGEKLFKRILRAAANHGVEAIEIVCLPENVGMQNLARKFHAHFTFEENSLTGRLTVRPPTALSLIPGSLERRARLRRRPVRRPLAGGGGGAGKGRVTRRDHLTLCRIAGTRPRPRMPISDRI